MEQQINHLRALVFDLLYDRYLGVIIYVRILEGKLLIKQKIKFNNQNSYQVEKIGVNIPDRLFKNELVTGEIGWFTANIRNIREINSGDIVLDINNSVRPTNPIKIKPNVYCNIYPADSSQFKEFRKSLDELYIQDASLDLQQIDSEILGFGVRCGFLGLLHRDVFCTRLEQEYKCEIIVTEPSIAYQITDAKGKIKEINNPQEIPSYEKVKEIKELFISINIFTPNLYIGSIIQLCQNKRGIYQWQEQKTSSFSQIQYHLPLAEFITDFHDTIKSISHGYASFDYEIIGFKSNAIVKVDILLNNQLISDLSFLVYRDFAYERAKVICKNLKQTLNQQKFVVPIQACIGKQVIARETLPALKKNVTGNLYGGDRTRKQKLWNKQKVGKKRMQVLGKVSFNLNELKKILKKKAE